MNSLLFRLYSRVINRVLDGKQKYYKKIFGFNNVFFSLNSRINIENKELSTLKIGDNTTVYGDINMFKESVLSIGENTFIGEFSKIFVFKEISIGKNCLLSHNVTIMDSDTHSKEYKEREIEYINHSINGSKRDPDNHVVAKKTTIGDNVWIGCNSIILKGITIGDRVIIAAGSVITSDIPSDSIVYADKQMKLKELRT